MILVALACGTDEPYFVSVLLPGDTYDTAGPYRVEAEVIAPNGVLRLVLRLRSESALDVVTWSDLPFAPIDADATGGRYFVELPGRPAGTVFRFYLQVVDGKRSGGGRLAVYPPGAPETLAGFRVKLAE